VVIPDFWCVLRPTVRDGGGYFFFERGHRGIARGLKTLEGRTADLLCLYPVQPGHTHFIDLADDRQPVIGTPPSMNNGASIFSVARPDAAEGRVRGQPPCG